MRTGTKIATGIGGGVLAVAIVGGAVVVNNNKPMIEVGTGYAAQAACVAEYLENGAGPGPDLPDDPMADKIAISYDQFGQAASGSIFGLFEKTSYYIDGVGCVVADERPEFDGVVPPIDARVQDAVERGGIPQPEGPLRDQQKQRAVEKSVGSAMDVLGARGVVVVKDGQLITEAYGEGFNEFTPQLGWSMTKSVANVLAGRLAMEDPSFDVTAPAGVGDTEISYSDLLRMQSGLAWDETYGTTGDTTQMLYRSPNMGDYVASKPAEHAPGTYREYSTGSTTLACQRMQDHSGMGPGMAWELLFRPLGMASASLAPDATGHLACGSYSYATPRDWAKLGQFVLNNGQLDNGQQLLPEKWMAASTTEHEVDEVQPESDGGTPPAYGSGWWLNKNADGSLRFKDLPEDMYWADGHDGQFMVVIPSANVVVVRQGFSPGVSVAESGVLDIAQAAL